MKRDFVGRVITRTCAEDDLLCKAVIQADPSGKGEDAQAFMRYQRERQLKIKESKLNKDKPKPKPSKAKPRPQSRKQPRAKSSKGRSDKVGQPSEVQSYMDAASGTVPEVRSINAVSRRVVKPFAEDFTLTFPQHVDLVTYSVDLYPAGDATGSDSLAREYFESSKGQKFLTDVAKAYRRTPTVAFTVGQLADYINTVSQAYAYLYAVRTHMRYCYWVDKQNLSERLGLIFDASIRDNHLRLADELSSHFLPPKLIAFIERMYNVYSLGLSGDVIHFQLTPWANGYNVQTVYAANYSSHISALRGLTNLDALRTAFASPFYKDVAVPMEQLNFSEDYKNPDNFLQPRLDKPLYDEDLLSIWMNLPLNAWNGASHVYYPVANTTTAVPLAYVGSGISEFANVMTSRYVTTLSRFEPGIIMPLKIPSSGSDNNFKYIDANGSEEMVDAGGASPYESTNLGILARSVENTYNVNIGPLGRVLPSGTSYANSSIRDIGYDTYEFISGMMS
jgi:hypothetical protein